MRGFLQFSRRTVLGFTAVMAAGLVATALLPAGDAAAQRASVTTMRPGYSGSLTVPIDKSQVLEVSEPFGRVTVGNPDVADVLPMTDRTVYVLGRSIGRTNMTVYDADDRLLAVIDIDVTHDAVGLRGELARLFPDERISVRSAAGSIVINGTVSSAQRVSQIGEVAERFAPNNVSNLLTVGGSQQVMLSVRFAEVSRSFGREISTEAVFEDGDFTLSTLGGLVASPFVSAGLTGLEIGSATLDFFFDALENQGVIKTLAEPNLIALTGRSASFLAGGEFPVPVAQEEGAVTVEFKPFGVGLSFTPTVVTEDLINLELVAEVSQVDETFAATAEFGVPGISTRRTETVIELRDGQSFAIAGLLQSNFSDSIRSVPWANQVPVLGALFRSAQYQNNETELVVIVTPYLVQPSSPDALAMPTDGFVAPTDFDLFLLGKTEGTVFEGGMPLSLEATGGIAGSHGHILQ